MISILFCNPFFDGTVFWAQVTKRLESNIYVNFMIHQIFDISSVDAWVSQFLIERQTDGESTTYNRHMEQQYICQ